MPSPTLVTDLLLTDAFLIKGAVDPKKKRLSTCLDELRGQFVTVRDATLIDVRSRNVIQTPKILVNVDRVVLAHEFLDTASDTFQKNLSQDRELAPIRVFHVGSLNFEVAGRRAPGATSSTTPTNASSSSSGRESKGSRRRGGRRFGGPRAARLRDRLEVAAFLHLRLQRRLAGAGGASRRRYTARMWVALALIGLQATAATAEARIDFYSVTNASEDVELQVEAEAVAAASKSDPAAKPKKVTRILSWKAGGHDNEALAGLVAQALSEGGLEATSDGAETIIKNASAVAVHTKSWTALGAQVWVVAPAGTKPAAFSVVFEPAGKVGKGLCVVSSSAKTAGPKPPTATTRPRPMRPRIRPAAARRMARIPRRRIPRKNRSPRRPQDPKAKPAKPNEIKVGVPEASDGAAVRAAHREVGRGRIVESRPRGARGAPDRRGPRGSAPRWVAIRFVGKGEASIGVRVAPPPSRSASGQS